MVQPILLRLEVTLVSVRGLVEADGKNETSVVGSDLEGSTWPRLASLTGGTIELDVSGALALRPNDESVVRQDVFKFVQLKDRYMALASTLLKSRAYHQHQQEHIEQHLTACINPAPRGAVNQRRPRALVRLPRTVHGRPYLPLAAEHSRHCDLNVSHQYPVVGIVRMAQDDKDASSVSYPRLTAQLRVGIDVVMFNSYPPRLYGSVAAFVESFRDMLTGPEWDVLQSLLLTAGDGEDDEKGEAIALREFYLHWALKEAYSKALGMGLGYDFGSFHVLLQSPPPLGGGDDDGDSAGTFDPGSLSTTSILRYWRYIMPSSSPTPSTFRVQEDSRTPHSTIPATVHYVRENRTESWSVALRPIYEDNRDGRATTDNLHHQNQQGSPVDASLSLEGCFCVFLGPWETCGDSIPASNRVAEVVVPDHELLVDWMDVEDLIRYHTG